MVHLVVELDVATSRICEFLSLITQKTIPNTNNHGCTWKNIYRECEWYDSLVNKPEKREYIYCMVKLKASWFQSWPSLRKRKKERNRKKWKIKIKTVCSKAIIVIRSSSPVKQINRQPERERIWDHKVNQDKEQTGLISM